MRSENQDIIDHICEFFQVPINEKIDVSFKKSKNIQGRIYFHFDSRFKWPSLMDPLISEHGFCHALSQQIGIHADGTVIPCCLDKEAGIPLGNILEQGFEEILNSEKLIKMREGFKKHLLTEELCRKCTYIKRFEKKLRP
jgi:radical SAM protein with 4Fe4S-binding SPASM domain